MRRLCLSVLILACAVSAPAEERIRAVLSTRAAQGLPPLRAEGQTELITDHLVTVIFAAPIPAGMQVPTGTICLAPHGYAITSRTLGPGDSGPLFTEALAIAGNPLPDEQSLCEDPNNNCVNFAGSKANKNVFRSKLMMCPVDFFQGQQVLVWENIPLEPLGDENKASLRLTNVRVDATSTKPAALYNVILLIGKIAMPQSDLMDMAKASLDFSVRTADSNAPLADVFPLRLCEELPQTRIATLRFAELFPGAFRPRSPAVFTTTEQSPEPADNAGPVHPWTTETGFYNHLFGGAVPPGLAEHSTRLRVTLSNIPPGARVFVDAVNSAQSVRLVDGNSVPFLPLPAASGKVELTAVNGSAVATWEVLRNDPSVANNLDFGVYLSYSPTPGATPDQLLQGITVQGGYAPPVVAGEIPSFRNPSTGLPPIALARLVPCLTITTASPLPTGVVGTFYSLQLTAIGGDGLTWASNGLPPGLSVNASGLLSGTPTAAGPFSFDATAASGMLKTTKSFRILISDLRILTLAQLPIDAVVGRDVPPNPLKAAGGTPPYMWSIAPGSDPLPSGITLNANGTFTGKTTDIGDFCVTVQVIDFTGISKPGQVCGTVLPLATVNIRGLQMVADPNGTQAIRVELQKYLRNLDVTLTVDFQPGALSVPLNPGGDDPDADDSEVGFPGGQPMTFPITIGATLGPLMMLRTGTVAGAITISASASLPDGTVIGGDQQVVTVPLMRPAITDLRIQPRTGGFDVCVTGFATNREVTSAAFEFQPVPGSILQGNLATVPVGPVFEAAYRQEGSGAFVYVQSFQVQGNISDIASVTVTLANSRTEGAPEIATRKAIFADFPAGSVCPPPI